MMIDSANIFVCAARRSVDPIGRSLWEITKNTTKTTFVSCRPNTSARSGDLSRRHPEGRTRSCYDRIRIRQGCRMSAARIRISTLPVWPDSHPM